MVVYGYTKLNKKIDILESGLESHLTPKSPKGVFFKLLIFSCSPLEPVPMKIMRLGVKTTKISSLKAF